MDLEQFANIRDEVFIIEMEDNLEVKFEAIMNQGSKEILSDDTGYASDLNEYDTDHAEKFVSPPKNPCTERSY